MQNNTDGISIAGGAAEIKGNEIRGNGTTGVHAGIKLSNAGFNGVKFLVQDNLIEDNSGAGIDVIAIESNGTVAEASISGNTVRDNLGKAIQYQTSPIPPDIDENTVTGNGKNGIWLAGRVDQSTTWGANDYALVVDDSDLLISSGVTLTLAPGAIVKVHDDNNGVVVNGTLDASGTLENPVTFTSVKDDSIGGDTNGDGGATIPEAGDWKDVIFSSTAAGQLSLTDLRYGGAAKSGDNYTMVMVKCPCVDPKAVTITNSRISKSAHSGIRTYRASPKIIGNEIFANKASGIDVMGGAPVEIKSNEIKGNGTTSTDAGIKMSNAGVNGVKFLVQDNLIEESSGAGIDAVAHEVSGSIAEASISDNTVKHNLGKGIDYLGSLIPPDIDENTVTGNGKNGIWLAGRVDQSTTWGANDYALVVDDTDLWISAGVTLTLDPGAIIKVHGDDHSVVVNGALDVSGSAENPVTVTSVKDDSIGGDTNGDGGATIPEAGDWEGIQYANAEGESWNHIGIRYAHSAVDLDYLTAFLIADSDFVHNVHAIEVASTAASDPTLAGLACIPPYLSFVALERTWFSPFGLPSPSLDLSSVVGATIPAEYAGLFGSWLSLAAEVQPNYKGENAIPFSIYSCPPLGIGPIPVSPVVGAEFLMTRNFPGP